MTPTVRRLGPAEEDAAFAALERLADDPPNRESLRRFLASEKNYLVVGYLGELPAGFAIANPLDYVDGRGPIFFLWEIGTHEDSRRQGVARAMIEFLLAEARARGYSEMFVITAEGNREAMPLYETTGAIREALDDVVWVYDTVQAPKASPTP
jgi:ribosomal protein S18 acetylase RimI-like enzyme